MSYSPNPYYTIPSVAPAQLHTPQERAQLSDERLVCTIVVAATCYTLVLCFINNNIMALNRSLLGATEAIILLMCAPLLLRRLLPSVLILGAITIAQLCLIWAICQQINIKSLRDIAMPLCFFWLGCNVGQKETADRALKMTIWVVLIIGFFELLLLDYYTRWFDIFSYYVNMGVTQLSADTFIREDRLMANGMRPEGIGRTLLPQLIGPHRVSSVFLEPVSLGNFATICAAWGLCRPASRWREGAFFVIAALVLIVLCDSRFAIMTVSLLVVLRLLLSQSLLYLCMFTPVAAITLILVVGYTTPNLTGYILEDNLHGRLAYSGWSLLKFDIPKLFGIGHTKVYYDEGYAHILATFGLPLALILWISFWLLPTKDSSSQYFRAMISVYIALILCVSGTSFFALKTSGILRFLVGCSVYQPALGNHLKSSLPVHRSMSHAD